MLVVQPVSNPYTMTKTSTPLTVTKPEDGLPAISQARRVIHHQAVPWAAGALGAAVVKGSLSRSSCSEAVG